MKFYYYIIGIVFLFFVKSIHLNAQNKDYYGFSKTYFYSDDSLKRFGSFFSDPLFLPDSNNFIVTVPWLDSKWNGIIEWLKIDTSGNVILRKTDSVSNSSYTVESLKFAQNDSKSFFVPGFYYNNSTKLFTARLQKRDTALNLLWEKEFPFGPDSLIYKNSILQLVDGDIIQFMSLGVRDSNSSNVNKLFIYLIKTDSLGNLIWKKEVDKEEWNNAGSIIFAHDGNILISSLTSGYGVSTVGAGFVMKIDTAGSKIWHKVYNLPDYNGLEKIIATGDGHYICAGWARTPSTVIYMSHKMPNAAGRLLKIDENGNIIWDKIIDISDREESFRTLVLGNNGDIIAFGSSNKYYAYDSYNYQVGSTREPDGWAVRLDKDGNIKWSRVFGHNATPYAHEYLYSGTALSDGGFITSGCTQIYDSLWKGNSYIYGLRQVGWIVKLDSMGCLGPGCPEMLADYIDSMKNPKPPIEHITEITLYPNPGGNQAILENKAGFSEDAFYYISDISGKIIQDKTYIGKQTQVSIHFKGSANAQYIIKLQHNFGLYSFKYAKVKD